MSVTIGHSGINVVDPAFLRTQVFWVCFLLTLSLGSAKGERLHWENSNQPGQVRSFTLYLTGPLPSATIRQVTVATNDIDLESLLKGAPSGIYSLYGVSVGTNGLRSEKSQPILIPWTAPAGTSNPPVAPCSTVAYRHESAGVVVQMFHDKAHSYGATLYKATSSGKACRIEVNLRKLNQPAGEITVYVWNSVRNHPGTVLAASATTIDASKIRDGWYEAMISFPHRAGETYWIGLGKTGVHASNNILWLGGGLGARYYSADGQTWVYSSSESMNLRVFDE